MSSRRAAERLTAEIIRELLALLAKGGQVTTGKLTAEIERKLPRSLKASLRAKGNEREIKRLLYYLRGRGYVRKLEGRADDTLYALTTQGLRRLEELSFMPLGQRSSQKWDGRWRVLVFDIPEDNRLARDAIRRLIRQLGFIPLQKSVWIQPFACAEEIKRIKDAYGIKDHITLLEVSHFEQEPRFKKLFRSQLG